MKSTERPVLCLGEALIDVIKRAGNIEEKVGGSVFNVACGVASLGHPTSLASWWGKDERGKTLEEKLVSAGVHVISGSNNAQKTPIANAQIDNHGQATYTFDLEWQVPPLPEIDSISHLHTGSFAATLTPGASAVLEAVEAMAIQGTISYDPNVRPSLMGTPEQVRPKIEKLISLADVVKASDEDIAWLYGKDTPLESVLHKWKAMGPGLVVATRGPWASYALCANDRDMLAVDPLNTQVKDTVGAGDSFMAGLISGLLDAGLLGSAEAKQRLQNARLSDIQGALYRATVTSGITVSKVGAYAPNQVEVAKVYKRDPSFH
nr:carbohydrate kinase [Varibaculum vaginae]